VVVKVFKKGPFLARVEDNCEEGIDDHDEMSIMSVSRSVASEVLWYDNWDAIMESFCLS